MCLFILYRTIRFIMGKTWKSHKSKEVKYEQEMLELEYVWEFKWLEYYYIGDKKNSDKDDDVFKTILRGLEIRISEKILTTMYGDIRTDNENTDGYNVLPWTSEPYILREDKEMEDYIPQKIAYAGEIICDTIFLNHVHFAKY